MLHHAGLDLVRDDSKRNDAIYGIYHCLTKYSLMPSHRIESTAHQPLYDCANRKYSITSARTGSKNHHWDDPAWTFVNGLGCAENREPVSETVTVTASTREPGYSEIAQRAGLR